VRSSAALHDSPPRFAETWRVEQAHTPPHASSISMPLPSAISRIEPGEAGPAVRDLRRIDGDGRPRPEDVIVKGFSGRFASTFRT
jgi:hypothetical protein